MDLCRSHFPMRLEQEFKNKTLPPPVENISVYDLLSNDSSYYEDPVYDSSDSSSLLDIEQFLLNYVIVAICGFGVIGNFLTLLVLSQRRFAKSKRHAAIDSSIAKTDVFGLTCLSVSDILFCVSILPYCVIDLQQYTFERKEFRLYFLMYSSAVINTFILCSTWLTITMTINRYVHLCHPLHGMRYCGYRIMTGSICLSILFSTTFNLPRVWLYSINETICLDPDTGSNVSIYYQYYGLLMQDPSMEMAYQWLYFIVGILVPLCVLVFCNWRIIRALYRSLSVETRNSRGRTMMTKVTICIIISYLLLVSPAEIIKFLFGKFLKGLDSDFYNLSVTICNTFQAINFAMKFIPYLFLDKMFRQHVCRALCHRKNNTEYGSLRVFGRTEEMMFSNASSRNGAAPRRSPRKQSAKTTQSQFF